MSIDMTPAWWARQEDRGVTLLTLRRPPINALDRLALEELDHVVGELEATGAARALVIASGLDGVFCSGGDLKYWRHTTDGKEVGRIGRSVLHRLASLPVPVLAAIDGHVIFTHQSDGGGPLGTDHPPGQQQIGGVRAPDQLDQWPDGSPARNEPVGQLGQPERGAVRGHPEIAGQRERHAITEVTSSDHVLDLALERGDRLAGLSRGAVGAAKCALRGGDERACFERVWGSAEWREGIDALLSKRAPDYRSPQKGADGHDLPGRIQEDRFADRGSRCC